MKTVYLACKVHPVLTDFLLQNNYNVLGPYEDDAAQQAAISSSSGLVISNKLKVTAAVIDSAPSLEWIARLGSGMEIIDVAYARSKHITCINSPDGNSNAVAEHAVGLLIALTKNIWRSGRQVLMGEWLREPNRGIELEHRTVGIIGFGHTGAAFAKKLQALDMRIMAYDINDAVRMPSYVERAAALSKIFSTAEFISFHVPLNDTTKHYFNTTFLDQMARPFYIINTSRGPVVEPEALLKGMTEGKIVAAALDVWPQEPPTFHDPVLLKLQQQPNFLLTPHIAGYSVEAEYKMSISIVDQLKAITDKGLSDSSK